MKELLNGVVWRLRSSLQEQCQEQPRHADQVKDGLHEIRQKKRADLAGKLQEELKKLGGQLALKALCFEKPIYVQIGWLCIRNFPTHDQAQVHTANSRILVSVLAETRGATGLWMPCS